MSEPITERWTYLGKRLTTDNKLVHAWLDPEEHTTLWPKLVGHAIGGVYNVRVVRVGDRAQAYPPEFTGETVEEASRARFAALDAEARQRKLADDAEKRLSKSKDLELALAPLELVAASCRGFAEIDALNAVVRRRLMEAWRKS